MNLDEINKIVINIPERVERLTRTEVELNKFFNNTHYTKINGVTHLDKSHRNIAQAHINAITFAYNRGWDKAIIIEDDVHFYSNKSREYADECLKNLPDDWDVLLSSAYLYAFKTKVKKDHNSHWDKLKEFCGLTTYIINVDNCYKKIINFDFNKHIDRAFATDLNLNCFVTKKYWTKQYSGYSDNTKRNEDYDYMINKINLLETTNR